MTNNPTIDGVSRGLIEMTIDLLQDLRRGTAVERKLRALLDAPAVERQEPVAPMPEMVNRRDGWPEGYLESDNDWCDNNPEAVSWLADNHAAIRHAIYNHHHEVAAQQSTIARLEARVAELESGRCEPVAYVCTEWLESGEHATHARREPTHAHTVALYTGNKGAEKYDDVLLPFLAMMPTSSTRPIWL